MIFNAKSRNKKIKAMLNSQDVHDRNRALDQRRDNDNVPSHSISLEDIDRAIITQLRDRFNLSVPQGRNSRAVPVIPDAPAAWNWAGRQNLRSVNDKIMYPLLVVKRGPIQRDSQRDRDTKNFFTPMPGVHYTARAQYTEDHRYDAFAALTGEAPPPKKVYKMRMPRYITVSYNCTLYTEKMSSANDATERILYKSREYWGDPDDIMFYAEATGFDSDVQDQNDVRFVETSFSVEVNGYILPEDTEGKPTTIKGSTIDKIDFSEKVINPDL